MKRILFLIIITIFCSHCQLATSPVKKTSVSLKHLVRQPKVAQANPPMLVLLHGFGGNESNLFSPELQQFYDPKLLVVALQAPMKLTEQSFAWYNIHFVNGHPVIQSKDEEIALEQFIKVLDELINHYQVDKEKIIVGGFSQGAIMSALLALRKPEKIKGILLLSGQLPQATNNHLGDKEALEKMNVFISHGQTDEIITIEKAREMHEQLKAFGIKNIVYREHKGAHHLDGAHLREVSTLLHEWVK